MGENFVGNVRIYILLVQMCEESRLKPPGLCTRVHGSLLIVSNVNKINKIIYFGELQLNCFLQKNFFLNINPELRRVGFGTHNCGLGVAFPLPK